MVPRGRLTLIAFALALLAVVPAHAASPPEVEALWSSDVAATSARLHADLGLDPTLKTDYHFNYITEAEYQANLKASKEGFAGAKVQPPADAHVNAGPSEASVVVLLSNLAPSTTYRYRVVAKNTAGTAPSPVNTFITQATGGVLSLPDGRGWEMVSPVEKNGGQVDPPGANAGGGVLQGAADGQSATFSSSASFAGGEGAPPASQYISRRDSSGWTTQNITVPLFSGSYGTEHEGIPYRVFSGDLARGLLLNGRRCRSAPEGCAVANPPLPGSGAPTGYEDYYLREAGGFQALVDSTDILATALTPELFEVNLAGATPGLTHVVLSTCAALTANAVEAPAGEGCDSALPNLYRHSSGGLTLVNILPGDTEGTPGAALAARAGAISEDGARVYFTAGGNLYLRDGGISKQVDTSVAGGGEFEAASSDGAVAFFVKAAHLYRYLASSGIATDITPSGDVAGVLGASASGGDVYYQDASGLKRWHGGATTTVAGGAEAASAANFPPATGAARVSAGGSRLAFLSKEALTGYDNIGPGGEPVSEVFLYETGGTMTCASCNPTNERPIGPSTLPGAIANGEGPNATQQYKPRALSADGRRLFFDSEDALVLTDTNNEPDVYQWEANGKGSCAQAAGCLSLISSGRAEDGAFFFDASSEGSDAFFRTDRSLVSTDPGSVDLYDARVGGGFPVPTLPLPCVGDACQSLPPEPSDPTLNTLIEGSGNPPVRFYDTNRHRPRYHRLRNHHHVRKGRKKGGRRKGKRRQRARARVARAHRRAKR
jgi:hypothetical protein